MHRGLYAIVDPDFCRARSAIEVARAILRGGAAYLQLRAKKGSDAEWLETAVEIRRLCGEHRVPFVINDRAELARVCAADALHLGQDDLPLREARKIFSGSIGVSTHNLTQLERAIDDGADLCGFGPIFSTSSKLNPDPVVGLDALEIAVRLARTRRPRPTALVAIGGIGLEQVREIRATGCELIACISAVCGAENVEEAAGAFHRQALAESLPA